jgi:hypothetical protein
MEAKEVPTARADSALARKDSALNGNQNDGLGFRYSQDINYALCSARNGLILGMDG